MTSRRAHRGERAPEQDVAVAGAVEVERTGPTHRRAPPASFAALGPLAIYVSRSVTIARPRAEVFAAISDPETEARIMRGIPHLTRETGAANRTRWVVRGWLGLELSVETKVVEVIPDERIVWRSPPGKGSPSTGAVSLADAPGGRGTEVKAVLAYKLPGGILGRLVGKLVWPAPGEILRGALRHLQQLVEVGEIATIEGQPSGRGARTGG
jgi:uncharacterized membrane protein